MKLLITMSLLVILYTRPCLGSSLDTTFLTSLDLPAFEKRQLSQQLQYKAPFDVRADITLVCFQYRNIDSICLYHVVFKDQRLKRGTNSRTFEFTKADQRKHLDQSFVDVMQKIQNMPPGKYSFQLSITCQEFPIRHTEYSTRTTDSTVALNSPVRNDINKTVSKGKKHADSVPNVSVTNPASGKTLAATSEKMGRKLKKKYGVGAVQEERSGKTYTALYYKDWFLGRYEISEKKSMEQRAAQEMNALQSNPSSLLDNDLDGFTSIGSQVKKLHKKDDNETDIKGSIKLDNYFSTGQEPGSEQDLNFSELYGQINTSVFDIPVGIEGYYTTQDAGRAAKASFIRINYDVEAAKGELSQTITGYKSKYSQTASKGQAIEGIYQGAIAQLTAQKSKLLAGLMRDYSIDGTLMSSYDGDVDKMLADMPDRANASTGNDSTTKSKKEKITRNKEEIKKKYQQISEAQKKIDKYQSQIEQFNKQMYFDSALTYSKVTKLDQDNDVSYKKMAKAAEGLLPNGKAKSFLSGLTHLEAGIINRYESSYTMSGQTLKGGSAGYDIGFAEVSGSVGKTEYISRDGNVDQYTSYMGRADFKPYKEQKLGLIYYGYSPGKQILKDNNFIKSDVSVPTFLQPVHIVSYTYEGKITKDLQVQSEGATSFRKHEQKKPGKNNSAVKAALEYFVPKTNVSVGGEWEHVGREFENNVLPYTKAATERYTISAKASLFQSFLSAGVQYNLLKQESFASTGYSRKWGFDLQTHSRRYPNVYVSYKPYSTFRSYDDTLSIQQRPIVGEVWTGKGSYQLKRPIVAHRFMAIYNQNSSTQDTQQYKSKTLQLAYIYTTKLNTLMANGGWMQTLVPGSTSTNIYFLSASINRKLTGQVNAMLVQDLALAKFGVQRHATTAGITYAFLKVPIEMRIQTRYTRLRSTVMTGSNSLWAGQLGMSWQFKTKAALKKKN